jgi:hypothetical protein
MKAESSKKEKIYRKRYKNEGQSRGIVSHIVSHSSFLQFFSFAYFLRQ